MEETSEYIFEKKDDKFYSWRVVHHKLGGYTENGIDVSIKDKRILISDERGDCIWIVA